MGDVLFVMSLVGLSVCFHLLLNRGPADFTLLGQVMLVLRVEGSLYAWVRPKTTST